MRAAEGRLSLQRGGGLTRKEKKIAWKDGLSAIVAILCARVFLFPPICLYNIFVNP